MRNVNQDNSNCKTEKLDISRKSGDCKLVQLARGDKTHAPQGELQSTRDSETCVSKQRAIRRADGEVPWYMGYDAQLTYRDRVL